MSDPHGQRAPRPKRRYPRLTVRVDVELETSTERTRALATTLGAGGVFIATDRPWLPGTLLVVHLQLPESERWLAFQARVAWSHVPGESPHSPGMGIAFLDRTERVVLAEQLELWARGRERSAAPEDARQT